MNTDHKNITEVEINGAMIPFDFTDQIEFFNMAMTVGCTRTKTTTKPSEADLANSFLVVFQAFATAVSATLTSTGGDTDTDGEKKT